MEKREKAIKRLTAQEARKLATENHWLEKQMYKWIEEISRRSSTSLHLGIDLEWAPEEIEYALNSLTENGYTVKKKFSNSKNEEIDGLVISW